MSSTPIFDATLADAPVNIWQASSVFPIPADISCAAVPAYYFLNPANINPLLGAAA